MSSFSSSAVRLVPRDRWRGLLAIGLAIAVASCSTMGPHAPKMSVQFPRDPNITDDWVHGFGRADTRFAYARMVPPGETMDKWTQSIVVQTLYVPDTVRDAVEDWIRVYRRDDPRAKIAVNTFDDGSMVVESWSEKLDEIIVRKFIEGPDGIYTVAYIVHAARYDRLQWAEWKVRIHDAELVER